jgi:predicted GTPase
MELLQFFLSFLFRPDVKTPRKTGFDGVTSTENVVGNGRKKILVIGKTGTGKSSLSNVISGHHHDADIFPVSSDPQSCTLKTKFADVFFNKNKAFPVSVIDTIGFDEPTREDDAVVIADLVDNLKYGCDHVNLFVIAVNGQAPRLDGSLLGMIRIFEGMFPKEFWNQVVFVFTKMRMDEKTRKRRERDNRRSDEEVAENYLNLVRSLFEESRGLKYLYIDALYDKNDSFENYAFQTALKTLGNYLHKAPALSTTHVKEVETEKARLKRTIGEKERELETHRKLQLRQRLADGYSNMARAGFATAVRFLQYAVGAFRYAVGGPVAAITDYYFS